MVEDVNDDEEEDEGEEEEGDEEEEEEEETAQPWNGLKTLPVGCWHGVCLACAVQGTDSAGVVLCRHGPVQGLAMRGWPCCCVGMGMVQGQGWQGSEEGVQRGKG